MGKEIKCVRCGLPKSQWKGRWEEALCGEWGKTTTYDTHKEKEREDIKAIKKKI